MRVGRRKARYATFTALLAAAGVAHADYKDDYSRGLKAYEDGQFAEARTLMQQALSDHPQAAERVKLYGMVFKPYVPQHYLGMAAYKLNDCATALAQWNSAENRQVIGQLSDLAGEEQRGAAACGQKAVAKTEPPPTTSPVGNDAGKSETVAKTESKTEPPAKTNVADSKSAKPPVVQPPPVKPAPPADKPAVAVVKSGPPEPLLQAFDNYLAGRYADVARINPDSYADTRARFHAYLVRAASRYTQSRLSGDEEMLKGARADVLAARQLDGRTLPDATLFSPAFRAFFAENR
ncbi:MAG TPA: hypothetical protein VFB32_03530 [Rudaea sp.]|nr:hypothetical protein [Rudaea sp.]